MLSKPLPLAAMLLGVLWVGLTVSVTWAASTPMGICAEGSISVHCGETPSATWHQDKLWVVFVQNEQVYVAYAQTPEFSFSTPVRVTTSPEDVETNGENRPKIAVTEQAILVSWTKKTEGRFNADIRFSRSLDQGKTFEEPRTINDDGQLTGHRFDNLLVTPGGTVYVVWLDKRNLLQAQKKGQEYTGSAVFYAVSTDHGESFSKNFAVADQSCECCRIAVAPAKQNNLAIFWRHIYEQNTRDHGLAIVTPSGTTLSTNRATFDDWQVDACPHHGPDMAFADGGYHLAWFSNGIRQQGILYGFFDLESKTSKRVAVMDEQASASHPQVLAYEDTVYFVWKWFDGEQTRIELATSVDAGRSWSSTRTLASTAEASDHPLLIASATDVYLAWHSRREGYRIVPIVTPSPRTRPSPLARTTAGTDADTATETQVEPSPESGKNHEPQGNIHEPQGAATTYE